MNAVQAYLDRRAFGRRATHIAASVRIGYRIEACTIKDLSEGGALLEFPENVELPARLWLSWRDMPNEVVCEVRHVRGRNAGVQFARPISLAIRPTSAPAEGPALAPPPAPAPRLAAGETGDGSLSASEIVARRRNALRPRAGDAITAVSAPAANMPPADVAVPVAELAAIAIETVDATHAAVPRDASSILASMHVELARQAEAIISARTAAHMPMPLAARFYAGAPLGASVREEPMMVRVPRPLAAAAYASAPAPIAALPLRVPGPLSASAYASADVPSTADATQAVNPAGKTRTPARTPVPGPLAAALYGRLPGAVGLLALPPQPLAASAYAI